MDLVLPYRPNRLTPAKHQAEESQAADECDILSKKLKVGEILTAMEADLPSDVKSDDDLLLENQNDESPPANTLAVNSEDLVTELPNAFSEAPSNLRAEDLFEPVGEGVFSNEREKRNYELHVEEFTKSEGFDLKHFCDRMFGAIMPLALNEDDPFFIDDDVYRDCKKSVEAAINYYNNKNKSSLKLQAIIKCFYARGTVYYTTFDAKDTHTGVNRSYQTKLYRHHRTGKTTIVKFRLRHLNPYSDA